MEKKVRGEGGRGGPVSKSERVLRERGGFWLSWCFVFFVVCFVLKREGEH